MLYRQIGDDAVEEEGGLVQEPFGRLNVLEDDALGHGLEPRLIVVGKLLAGEDDDGQVVQGWLRLKLLQQLEAVDVGQAQVEHDAIVLPLKQGLERLASGGDGRQLDVGMVEQLDDGLALDVVVLDDQEPFGARGGEVPEAIEGGLDALGGWRLDEVGKRPVGEGGLPLLVHCEDLHGNVPHGRV